MIIDFHTHIFPDRIAEKTIEHLGEVGGVTAATDGTINGLLKSMEEKGVDLSVILPVVTKPSQFQTVNDFAEQLNVDNVGKLISFGGIHPKCEDYKKELDYIKSIGLKGIKLHPDYQGMMIDDLRYMKIIEYASEIGLMIMTHAGIDIGFPDPVCCPPDKMRYVIDKVQPKNMILAHLGGWKQWDMVEAYLVGQDVYLDTAFTDNYLSDEQFVRIIKNQGANKILFATDSPWSDATKGIEQIERLDLTREEKDMIFYKNASKLLGI